MQTHDPSSLLYAVAAAQHGFLRRIVVSEKRDEEQTQGRASELPNHMF